MAISNIIYFTENTKNENQNAMFLSPKNNNITIIITYCPKHNVQIFFGCHIFIVCFNFKIYTIKNLLKHIWKVKIFRYTLK